MIPGAPANPMPPGVGLGDSNSGGMPWDKGMVLYAAQYSPQIALAKALGMAFAPFFLAIQNTFEDSTTLNSNPQTFQGATQAGQQTGTGGLPSIIERINYEIVSPQAFPGSQFKSQYDWFYGQNSGISATMSVLGAPKYVVAPNYIPLTGLLASLGQMFPRGWVLQYNQSIVMQFQQTVPVPFPPTTVTCTFAMWQPIDTRGTLVQLSTTDAFKQLIELGYDQDGAITRMMNAPVNR
jgi:hypothetical protein